MKALVLILGLIVFAPLASEAYSMGHGPAGVSFGIFYSSLGSYGEWIDVNGGTYAWRPTDVGAGWRPYMNGHWVWTDDGWYWASDEPWGWATFHYGRWYFDDFYGWVWIPGDEWAPAWVEWRYGGDYVGWAPLGPYAAFSIGLGIHYTRHWATPYNYWSFTDCRYVGAADVRGHLYRVDENNRFIGRTRNAGSLGYANGHIVSRGPERGYVEQRGHVRIDRGQIYDVGSSRQSGIAREGGAIRVGAYRPAISRPSGSERPGNVREGGRAMGIDSRSLYFHANNGAPRAVERRAAPAASPAQDTGHERRPANVRSRESSPRPDAVRSGRARSEERMERAGQPRGDAAPNMRANRQEMRPRAEGAPRVNRAPDRSARRTESSNRNGNSERSHQRDR